MSKYQKVMDHVQVDDEMKKRILQNVEKEIGKESTDQARESEKVTTAPKKKIVDFRRYAAIAATFAVLLIGSYAVIQMTGDIKNTSSTMSDSTSAPAATAEPAMSTDAEAPAMEEAMEEAAEVPAMEEAKEEAAEVPAYNEDAIEPSVATESAGAANNSMQVAKAADITIKYENAVAAGDVWILDNTQENLKTSLWGTATLQKAKKDTEYSLTIPANANNSYLFRMIDEDEIYYESGEITLKEGYSISIFYEGEYRDVRMVIYDENGAIVEDSILFNAAL